MQWAAKKNTFLALGAIGNLAVIALFYSAIQSQQTNPILPRYCFESVSATIRVTTETSCGESLLDLGSGALSESATADGSVHEIHPLLAARFNAAQVTASREGVNLFITSGFRTRQRQGELFAEAVEKYGSESEAAKWVLPPQYSHHPHGLAIDVNYPGDQPGAYWLELNGSRFGLCRVYSNEWWHFEGVIAPGEKCPAMASNALVDLR